jgi:hypothetical protein
MATEFCLRNISIHARKVLLHAVYLQQGTDGSTSPPKEVVLRIVITLKNPSPSVRIEPANLGSIYMYIYMCVCVSVCVLNSDFPWTFRKVTTA